MKNRHILLFRNTKADFVFSADYVQFLIEELIKFGFQISVYDVSRRRFMDFHTRKCVVFFNIPEFLNKSIVRVLFNVLALIKFALTNKQKFDVANFMYCRLEYLIFARLLLKISKVNLVSIFGSDFNNYLYIHSKLKYLYRKANGILFSNELNSISFLATFKKEKVDLSSKIKIIYYPINRLNILQDLSSNYISRIREKYGININKTVVFCGINANKNEQHELIIRSLELFKELSGDLVLIFPLTYGGTNDYKNKIMSLAKEKLFGIQMIFLTEYLTSQEIAALSTTCDLYINIRRKDQYAASIFEAFYNKSLLITGTWLPYSTLKEEGFYFHEINSIEELGVSFRNAISDLKNHNSDFEKKIEQNRNLVIENYNPNKTIDKWINFYQTV
jgi:glycosyltransferase involved in cell wall biosynthesis